MDTRKGSRGLSGQVVINHKGVEIPTSVGSLSYEGVVLRGLVSSGSIPLGYAHRPDLIANLFLDTPNLWWYICEQNSIFDIFEQLNSGDLINLPPTL